MDFANAFLAAIIAAPDDDLPRLIYADWLDERGDPRGEFIRARLVLAAAPAHLRRPDGGSDWWDWYQRTQDVRRREAELLERHGLEWVPGQPDVGDGGTVAVYAPTVTLERGEGRDASFTFLRGFVGHVNCPLDDWLRLGPAVVREYPPAFVDISGLRIHPSDPRYNEYGAVDGLLVPPALAAMLTEAARASPPGDARQRQAASDVMIAWAKSEAGGRWTAVTPAK